MDRRETSASVDATVIVVTHNSAEWIEKCLASVFAQEYAPGFEVVVVDHESGDSSVEIIRRRFPKARLIQAPNRGFGAGCNRGAREASGRNLAFLNPDAVAEPGWLRELLAPLEAEKTMATSQILLLDDPTRLNTLGHGLHFTGLGFVRGYRGPLLQDQAPWEVPGVSGAAFAIRHDDYDALGGFDEAFFLYQDDTDLSWRARRRGFRVLLVPGSRARHRYTFRLSPDKLYHLERGRRLLLRKHLRRGQLWRWSPSLAATRVAIRIASLRYGRAGWKAVGRAAKDARITEVAREPPGEVPLHAFLARRFPHEALLASRVARLAGVLLNLVFWGNTASWGRRWKDRALPGGRSR